MSYPQYFLVATKRGKLEPGHIYIDQKLFYNPKPIDFHLYEDTIIQLFSLDTGFYVRFYPYSPSTKKYVYIPPNRKSIFITPWRSLFDTDRTLFTKIAYEDALTNVFLS